MTDGLINPEKTEPARFEPGGPAGPGRPKGSRSKVAKALDGLAAEDAEGVYAMLRDMALGGDLQACKEILSRAWPVPKGRAVEIDLAGPAGINNLPQNVAKVLEAVAAGELIPSEAQELVGVIEAYRKSLELSVIEERLAALEKQSTGKKR